MLEKLVKSFPCPFLLCSLLLFQCLSTIINMYMYTTKRGEKEEDGDEHSEDNYRGKEDHIVACRLPPSRQQQHQQGGQYQVGEVE